MTNALLLLLFFLFDLSSPRSRHRPPSGELSCYVSLDVVSEHVALSSALFVVCCPHKKGSQWIRRLTARAREQRKHRSSIRHQSASRRAQRTQRHAIHHTYQHNEHSWMGREGWGGGDGWREQWASLVSERRGERIGQPAAHADTSTSTPLAPSIIFHGQWEACDVRLGDNGLDTLA